MELSFFSTNLDFKRYLTLAVPAILYISQGALETQRYFNEPLYSL